ncbi:MAG TPA: hypothetical protein VK152_05115, partial [Paludibacter sp.]|nr:hypothetical protein [Paludibacter sp.]
NGSFLFQNGVSRWASRDLADIVQTQIVNDVRAGFQPLWTRRNIWHRSYSESRVPEVPSMLLELLSHQNFADMRYGLDPRFRFAVSRAVYKGILRYLSSVYDSLYVVQPLPVSRFMCRFVGKGKLELTWFETKDKLEPSATPDKYIVYTRLEDGGFDNGVEVKSNRCIVSIRPGKIYSFKVAAVNEGGESFPSEILSACQFVNSQGEVLIVNGFDRVCAPSSFSRDSLYAGFLHDEDPGVPYLTDISFVGKQYEFKRNKPWVNDDAPGFGASHANYETKVVAGNSFDYPYLHGKAIKQAGFSFVSCSQQSVLTGDVDMKQYKFVDLILGKQKQTFSGNVKNAAEFKTFPLALQDSISSFCSGGGCLLVSGAFVASDLCGGERPLSRDRSFLENVLKCRFRTAKASVGGEVKVVSSPFKAFRKSAFSYFDTPNAVSYYVESPDAIEPADLNAFTICRYAENNKSAAVAYAGRYKVCAFGFPFEAIRSERDRVGLMESVFLFFVGN